MSGLIVSPFGGPGGWAEGLRMLGLSELGIEWDAAACATRTAAGHLTVRADVAAYPTGPFVGKAWGATFSSPCQAFSQAGKGAGVRAMAVLARAAWDVAGGADVPPLDLGDERAGLVLEPVRWVRDLRPRWVACEQVPPVLPLWQLYAHIFGEWGYRCWTGVLDSADYGVPQNRHRAILLASLDRQPTCPPATHCEGGDGATMFGTDRLPWISMLEALPWLAELVGWDGPARTVCGSRSPRWMHDDPDGTHGRTVVRTRWVLHTLCGWDGEEVTAAIDEPSPTVTSKVGGQWRWTLDHPATTVCADPRLPSPGWRGRPDDYNPDGTYHGARSMDDAIRLTIRDGLILQGFRADYPVAGNQTKQWEQVGNAIPPPLAAHCIAAVTGLAIDDEAAA